MSYTDLVKITNIVDNKVRLRAYARYYRNVQVNGLHYVNFIPRSNTISISKPDHRTHHETTSYLLIKKNSSSINTTRGEAYDLKKFLDYLLIWNIDILDGDLYILILGFIDYLRSIQSGSEINSKAICWSLAEEVPLHQEAATFGQVVQIGYSAEGFMQHKNWEELEYSTIKRATSTVIQYLSFLKEKSTFYKSLSLNEIPQKLKYRSSMLSGTLGKKVSLVVDIEALLKTVGLKSPSKKESLLLTQKVFTESEITSFLDFIPNHHRQNRLLFYMLNFFGLRAAEASNLMIDPASLPKNLIFMEHFKAREYVKNHLKGDIEYSQQIKRWVCYVVERKNEDYRSQHKSGSRDIPFLFSEEFFLDLLLDALREREILIRHLQQPHSFLFVSRHSLYKGNPITGKTVNTRYTTIANKLLKEHGIDLTRFSPHSFRHFFATYLLRVKKEDISDVSRWLGHSDTEITRSTYSHYLPRDNQSQEVVKDMSQQFNREDD